MRQKTFDEKPYLRSILDNDFLPAELNMQAFEQFVVDSKLPIKVAIGIQRQDGIISVYETHVSGIEFFKQINLYYIERLIKTLLWIYGGFKIIVGGPTYLGEHIKAIYQQDGKRAFDAQFMSKVYEQPFEVVITKSEDVKARLEKSKPLGRHLDGCRIGFDAGGSDRKVSAVIDGKAIYSEEVIWHPKSQTDPNYHYQGILSSMKTAASKMPRIDAIGVSSAGIYIKNRIMAASLFIKVDESLYDSHVKNMYLDIAKELGDVPIEVANDGDVTALAGAMNLNANKVLGIAMGTSEAAGYVDIDGNITGWLNELAFVPINFHQEAPIDEWSNDGGCGVKYFSQDAVIRLAEKAKIDMPSDLSLAEKLEVVQTLLEKGDQRAKLVFDTIGIYLGYTLPYYARFYDFKHVLILGRVTSGKGGILIVEMANRILKNEFKKLYDKIKITLPDESDRRVGQSIAAASLPKIT